MRPRDRLRNFGIVYGDDRERLEHALQVAKEKREGFGEDVCVVWRDGTTHWLRSRGRFHYAANGEAGRSVGISLDITERKRAEEALLRHAAIVEWSEDAIASPRHQQAGDCEVSVEVCYKPKSN